MFCTCKENAFKMAVYKKIFFYNNCENGFILQKIFRMVTLLLKSVSAYRISLLTAKALSVLSWFYLHTGSENDLICMIFRNTHSSSFSNEKYMGEKSIINSIYPLITLAIGVFLLYGFNILYWWRLAYINHSRKYWRPLPWNMLLFGAKHHGQLR